MASEYFEAQAADVMATAGGDPANAGQLAAWAEDARGAVCAGVPRRQKTGA